MCNRISPGNDPVKKVMDTLTLPLRAFFYKQHKNVFLINIIPPRWHDMGRWDSLSRNTRTYLFNTVNIMGDDVLATQGGRASATMILTMLNQYNLV